MLKSIGVKYSFLIKENKYRHHLHNSVDLGQQYNVGERIFSHTNIFTVVIIIIRSSIIINNYDCKMWATCNNICALTRTSRYLS